MKVASVGRALPPNCVTQETATEKLSRLWTEQRRNVEALVRLVRGSGVETRYLTLPIDAYSRVGSFTEANDLFISEALELCDRAIRQALVEGGLDPSDVGLILLVTTSGLAAPSLDARLVTRLGFRPDVRRLPVFGLGCAGGAAGLARCADYLRGAPRDVALLVAVELCSLTFQRDDQTTAGAVASALFGDGAAAVVLLGEERSVEVRRPIPRLVGSRSLLYPNTTDLIGWRFGRHGFGVVLRPDVPEIVSQALSRAVNAFLGDQGLNARDVEVWLVHPGGPRVLMRVGEALGLPSAALEISRNSLRAFGNVSSASVLLMLGDVMESPPARGAYGVVVGVGPGLGIELILLQWL